MEIFISENINDEQLLVTYHKNQGKKYNRDNKKSRCVIEEESTKIILIYF